MRDLLSFVNLSVGLLLVLLWLGFPPPVIGQPPGSSAPLPFHVSADIIESKEGGRFLLARGDVRIPDLQGLCLGLAHSPPGGTSRKRTTAVEKTLTARIFVVMSL